EEHWKEVRHRPRSGLDRIVLPRLFAATELRPELQILLVLLITVAQILPQFACVCAVLTLLVAGCDVVETVRALQHRPREARCVLRHSEDALDRCERVRCRVRSSS